MNIKFKILIVLLFGLFPFLGGAQKVLFDNEEIIYKKSYIDPESGSKFWMLWTKYNYDDDPYFVRNIYIIGDEYTYDATTWGEGNTSRVYLNLPSVRKLIIHEPKGEEPFLEAVLQESATDYYTAQDNGHRYEVFFVRKWGKRLDDDIANEIIDLTGGDSKYHTHSILKRSYYKADVPGVITKSKIIKKEKTDLTQRDQEHKKFWGY